MEIETKINGLFLDPITNTPVVILDDIENNDRYLPIWIGVLEATAISVGLGQVVMPRPLTHDFFKKVMDIAGLAVEKVVIAELKETAYYALVYIKVEENTIPIDSRPSDAIAVAICAHCKIFVEEALLYSKAKELEELKMAEEEGRRQRKLQSRSIPVKSEEDDAVPPMVDKDFDISKLDPKKMIKN